MSTHFFLVQATKLYAAKLLFKKKEALRLGLTGHRMHRGGVQAHSSILLRLV